MHAGLRDGPTTRGAPTTEVSSLSIPRERALAVALAAVALLVILGGHVALDRGWMNWGPTAPIALRAFAAAIGLAVGIVLLAAYRGRGQPAALVVGTTFLGVGVIKAVRVAVAVVGVHADAPEYFAASLRMGWAQSMFMAVVLVVGLMLVPARRLPRGEARSRHVAFVVGTVAIGAVALLGPWFAGFPGGVVPESVVARPAAAWSAAAHLFMLSMLWRRPDVSATPEGRWLTFAVYVALLNQLLVAPFWTMGAQAGASSLNALVTLVTFITAGCGVVLGMVALARSERVAHERTVAAQREQQRVESALARQAARLKLANEELAQYAYLASHDLQEPLRMVTSYLQLVERRYSDVIDDEGREFMRFAVDGAVRMKRLTSDLLAYSQATARPLEPATTDANVALRAARDNLAVAILEADAEVTTDHLPTVPMAEVELVQLFQNLIGNALKFRREETRPRVHVSGERDDDDWRFSLRDNGIGIAARHHERVFAVFQRLHRGDSFPGSGIGLALCRKIVERHGGRIWFESTPGEGSTFSWTVPATLHLPGPGSPADDPELEERITSLIDRARELT